MDLAGERVVGTAEMARAAAYQPRTPTATALYALVRDHLETFLAAARARTGRSLPRYVEDEFRAYLRCGVLACGFARARCDGCGADRLVAFACKRRGVCPSCGARRMAGTAAHLAARVLPAVPVRQWVLSVPFELRRLLATRADALTAVSRIFVEEVFAWQRQGRPAADAAGGAVTCVQRFGGSLNLNVHFHVLVLDGVYARDDAGAPTFRPGAAPTRMDLAGVVAAVVRRVARWLRRRGLLDATRAEDRSTEAPDVAPLDACVALAQAGGVFGVVEGGDAAAPDADAARFERRPSRAEAAEAAGFNLHASVTVPAWDADGRERLCRYMARPAVSLARVAALPDGRVAYALKRPGRRGETHRLMTPLEFLARLAALIPPPRHPLVRFHGVLAPHSPWRAAVVPAPPAVVDVRCHAAPTAPPAPAAPREDAPPRVGRRRGRRLRDEAPETAPSPLDRAPSPEGAPRAASAAQAPGAWVGAAGARLDWATLLARVYDVDALACERCGGRMRFIATITEVATIRRILDHLRLPSAPPVPARARSPDDGS